MRLGVLLAAAATVATLGMAGSAGAAPPAKGDARVKRAPAPVTRFAGAFAFELAWDANIIHYSDVDLAEFETAPTPGKYSIRTADDWILRPRVDLVMETRALTGKPLETLLRISSWRYMENSVKNNESYTVRFRHPGWGRDNFQLTLYHAPEAYIRNFRDRPPYAPASQPMVFTPFTYKSTSAGLAYARTLSPRFDTRAEIRRSWRFYNQPFMENDNWEWRYAASLAFRPVRPLKLTGEYIYSDVTARAADQAGESAATSNDGDGSYGRDTYHLAVDLYLKNAPFRLAHVLADGQYQAFYYSSTRPLMEDPSHVGRKDEVTQFELGWDTRPVYRRMTLNGGVRFSRRNSSAPAGAAGGDSIDEDKDYTDRRSWIGFEVPF